MGRHEVFEMLFFLLIIIILSELSRGSFELAKLCAVLLSVTAKERVMLVPLSEREDDLVDARPLLRVMREEPADELLHFRGDYHVQRVEVLAIQNSQLLLILEGVLATDDREDHATQHLE